jgi:2-dehydropantoate 2-reductase
MRVVVVGAGSVGGFIGGKLAAAGNDVGAIARGATLRSLQSQGWRIQSKDGKTTSSPAGRCASTAAPLVEQGFPDLVILAVKAYSVLGLLGELGALLGPNTVLLSAMNGVPWWFFEEFGGPARGMPLPCVDPDGAIAQAIPHNAVLGCVVHLTCSSPEPGLTRHGFGERLLIGEPSGELSERAKRVGASLTAAGFEASVVPDIQREIWYKLWGNLTTNPISALGLATVDRITADPQSRAYSLAMMEEAAEIGRRIGCPIAQSGEARLDLTTQLGAFKTSMLQDREANRPMELDGLVTAVHLVGKQVGVPTPFVDSLLGLIRLLEGSLKAQR